MNAKTEGILAIAAAFMVLFSAMWDARISAGVAILVLAGFGIYRFVQKGR